LSGKSRNKKKKSMIEQLSDFSGYPMEGLTTSIPLLDCKWNREIQVAGCVGILEYDDCRIVLKTKRGNCSIRGEGLYMENFHRDTLSVHGTICGIWFSDGEEIDV